jgi:hypothetical protein
MAKIALFIWAVKSQRGNLDIGAFLFYSWDAYSIRSKMVDEKSVIKYFGCCSFKQARGAK